jgi:hypothetical protein
MMIRWIGLCYILSVVLSSSYADKYDDAIQDEMEYGRVLGASVAFFDGVSESSDELGQKGTTYQFVKDSHQLFVN